MTLQEYANLLVAYDIVAKDPDDDIYYFTDKGFMLLETFYPGYHTVWDNAINLTGWGGHPPEFWGIKKKWHLFWLAFRSRTRRIIIHDKRSIQAR